eukprot:CAMPEP_0115668036 /NCGR_PEP_ID=MMETSP0272-20121206/50255_1 /TAXON_ID=71861 /ORGANISM="Scrippsiella trochoidea, Strain CCMP3099" /LENGTH=84 /DNA_ID=CAMNT_0003106615 /DNA_START=311 /DNA_END=562 /DNA_ORIENTATION=-
MERPTWNLTVYLASLTGLVAALHASAGLAPEGGLVAARRRSLLRRSWCGAGELMEEIYDATRNLIEGSDNHQLLLPDLAHDALV